MAQTDTAPQKPFRAIVVGAGIAGLTLSHSLQLANIDHVVLEKHSEIVSIGGAALIIWPNAGRIFDQFGFLQKILSTTKPVTKEYRRWPDGTVNQVSNTMGKLYELFGVPPILFDRQSCVTHLYENLPDQSKVKLNKRVDRIEHTESGVRVFLVDGTTEEGDMLIGADGVHSIVRTQMWDYASKFEPKADPESDESKLFSEYQALVGVSKLKGDPEDYNLAPAESNIVYGQGVTKLFFQQSGIQYWALIFKDKYSQPPKKLKATDQDVEDVAKRFSEVALNETIKFSDLWESRIRSRLLVVEEGILSKWHAGRIVLVGDSAHKMTADLGMGANIAIEDAVALCNIMYRELEADRNRHPIGVEITSMFAEYQKERYDRAKGFTDISGKVTRMNSYDTLFGRVMATYIAPYLSETQLITFAKSCAKAPKLSYAPVQTIDENQPGWLLAKKKDNTLSTNSLVFFGVLAVAAGLVVSGHRLSKL